MAPTAVPVLPTKITEDEPVTAEQYQMALANVGLIGFVIDRFKVQTNDSYTAEDAWQDGWFGLVRACQKFQPERGHKFSTYAVVRIRSAMQKGRGHHEGSNYRRDIRSGVEHVRALSIDVDDEGAEPIRDRIADSTDVEAAAIASEQLNRLRCYASGFCNDEIDSVIVEAIFDPDKDASLRGLIDDIVARFGVSEAMVRHRVRRIKSRLVERSNRTDLVAAA